MSDYPHCLDGFNYAEDVLSGKILACKYIKQACQRFFDDLERDDLYFDHVAAENFCLFFEELSHVKGSLAGKRIELEPWQKFKFINIFGLMKKDSEGQFFRKYNEVYGEVPRKMGKSIDATGVALFMLAEDGEPGAEVYCGATSEKQASYVWDPAKTMLNNDPELKEHLDLEVHARSIFRSSDNSMFQRVIGDPGDGGSPHCGIVDEYHEHKKDDLYKTFQTGMGARQQPLLYVITTAGDNIGGPCHEKREECIQILDGVLTDDHADSTFVMIYTCDSESYIESKQLTFDSKEEEDAFNANFWKTEEALIMANPNVNVSVSLKWLKTQQAQAARAPKDEGHFKIKHLCLWVGQTEPFIPYDEWLKCADTKMRIEDFITMPCKMGVDLSSRIDFTASIKCFYQDLDGKRHYYWFPDIWLPTERINDLTESWKEFLICTPGNEIDTIAVKKKMSEDLDLYNIDEFVIDPYRSAGFEQELQDHGAEIVTFPQTIQQYTDPMDEFEAAVKSQRLHHPNHPVLNWMLSNFRAKRDTNGNSKPRKEDKKKKIDGIVAGVMALGRSMTSDDGSFDPTILTI